MLKIFHSASGLDIPRLAQIYTEYAESRQIFEFEDYLRYDFFSTPGAKVLVWEDACEYVSALRLEPYKDGFLITGLTTAASRQGRGFAGRLLSGLIRYLGEMGPFKLYSHIERSNQPSVKVHLRCGFSVVANVAVFLDGSVSQKYDTYFLEG